MCVFVCFVCKRVVTIIFSLISFYFFHNVANIAATNRGHVRLFLHDFSIGLLKNTKKDKKEFFL